MRRLVAGAVLSGAMLVGLAGPAFADDCANLSRKTEGTAPFTEKGPWIMIPTGDPLIGDIWVFDAPGDTVIVEGTGACNANRLGGQTKADGSPNGIWSQHCFEQALGG